MPETIDASDVESRLEPEYPTEEENSERAPETFESSNGVESSANDNGTTVPPEVAPLDPALQFVLEQKGGEPGDWKNEYQDPDKGFTFDNEGNFRDKEGNIWTEPDKKFDSETIEQFKEALETGGTVHIHLPDHIERTDESEILYVTQLFMDGKTGEVNYAIHSHETFFAKEEEPAAQVSFSRDSESFGVLWNEYFEGLETNENAETVADLEVNAGQATDATTEDEQNIETPETAPIEAPALVAANENETLIQMPEIAAREEEVIVSADASASSQVGIGAETEAEISLQALVHDILDDGPLEIIPEAEIPTSAPESEPVQLIQQVEEKREIPTVEVPTTVAQPEPQAVQAVIAAPEIVAVVAVEPMVAEEVTQIAAEEIAHVEVEAPELSLTDILETVAAQTPVAERFEEVVEYRSVIEQHDEAFVVPVVAPHVEILSETVPTVVEERAEVVVAETPVAQQVAQEIIESAPVELLVETEAPGQEVQTDTIAAPEVVAVEAKPEEIHAIVEMNEAKPEQFLEGAGAAARERTDVTPKNFSRETLEMQHAVERAMPQQREKNSDAKILNFETLRPSHLRVSPYAGASRARAANQDDTLDFHNGIRMLAA